MFSVIYLEQLCRVSLLVLVLLVLLLVLVLVLVCGVNCTSEHV